MSSNSPRDLTCGGLTKLRTVLCAGALWAFPTSMAIAQVPDVGPSGCVHNCGDSRSGERSSGGGGTYNPYNDAMGAAFGAFMKGFGDALREANDPARRSTAVNNEGVRHHNAGNYTRAIALYEQALRFNPNNTMAFRNLVRATSLQAKKLYRENDFEASLAMYQRAYSLNPQDITLKNNLEWAQEVIPNRMAKQRREREYREQVQAATDHVSKTLSSLSASIGSGSAGGSGLSLMEEDDPSSSLKNAKTVIADRSNEIREKILDAPTGHSAWDGGNGGTLDAPEAADVLRQPIPVPTGPRPPRYSPTTSTETTAAPPDLVANHMPIRQEAGLRPLSGQLEQPDAAKKVDAAIALAAALAAQKDYDGALRYLSDAQSVRPQHNGILEASSYVKGLKAAQSPGLDARLRASASPRAELVLDAIEAGQRNWGASIRYLEALKSQRPEDVPTAEALAYINGIATYQRSRGDAPPNNAQPNSRSTKTRADQEDRKDEPDRELEAVLADILGAKAFSTSRQSPQEALISKELETIFQSVDEQYIRARGSLGLAAIRDENFDEAVSIFGKLNKEYPRDRNIRDVLNYVEGLRDAKHRYDR